MLLHIMCCHDYLAMMHPLSCVAARSTRRKEPEQSNWPAHELPPPKAYSIQNTAHKMCMFWKVLKIAIFSQGT